MEKSSPDAINVTPNGLFYEHFRMLTFQGWRSISKTAKIFGAIYTVYNYIHGQVETTVLSAVAYTL